MKTKSPWRKNDQTRRLRLIMIGIGLVLTAGAGGLGYFLWTQLPQTSAEGADSQLSSPVTSAALQSSSLVQNEEFALVLVNQEQPWEGSVPVLVEVEGVSVDERIADALRQMLAAAQAEGCSLSLVKGYVSKEEQDAEYEEVVAQYMQQGYSRIKSEAEASLVVQKGGYSEYQTGLAVDFTAETLAEGQDFSSTKEYRWLVRNCVTYGFVLRYPEGKESQTGMTFNPSHFRYVGKTNAERMRALEMTLDEYAAYLARQQGR